VQAQQVMLRVTPPGDTARSAFFHARASTAGTFVLSASHGQLELQLGGTTTTTGAYHLTLMVGDSLMTNSGSWPLGTLLVTPAIGAQPLPF